MLSYQHIYHAGCLADVHKHSALAVVLAKMVEKDKPIYYMETHAGRGLYDLSCSEAQKTGEAKFGILALRGKLPAVHPYAEVLKGFSKNTYPGSPMIAHRILRQSDRLFLNELHPQEFGVLKDNMVSYSNVFLKNADGIKETLALSPPIVRRGLVLIDPSYEVKDDYMTVVKFVRALHRKWPETVIMLWYPILRNGMHREMVAALRALELPKFWGQEVGFKAARENNTIGSGLVICNLPFGCEDPLNKGQLLFK